jgi:outer membrane protein assembly factor BamB/tetratricopeptide (TPR) repeat protein
MNRTTHRGTTERWKQLFICLVVMIGVNWPHAVFAQRRARPLPPARLIENRFEIGIGMGAGIGPIPQMRSVDPESGAVLKTDPDLEASLETAERFKNDGNYRVATQLWQAVLQRSGDALYSSDGIVYFSLVRQVEQILSELPPAGLAAYRVIADAEAKEIMAQAQGPNDVTALNQVVRQYFISSLGDDTAFQLGCIYLDRFDFIGARRMFEKIVKQYPDPSVPLDQVLVRIALCQSYLGEIEAAEELLEMAKNLVGETSQQISVSRSLGQLTNKKSSSIVDADWKMRLNGPRRYGVMPAVSDEMMSSDLAAVWQYYFAPSDQYKWTDSKGTILTGKDSYTDAAEGTKTNAENRLIKSWQEKGWRPAGMLLLDEGLIYFKTGADLAVWSSDRIEDMSDNQTDEAKVADAIQWRSVWRNAFEVDPATLMIQTIRRSWGGYGNRRGKTPASDKPESTAEVQLFGDRIQQQISLHNGVLYSLEGKLFDERSSRKPRRVSPQWNTSFRRTRTNYLTAYDAKTGEVSWTLPKQRRDKNDESAADVVADVQESPWLEAGGFMSAPIGFGELIIVPVNQGGSISVYALDPKQDGKTVWNSFLCDEPESGAEPWSAINLSLDGSDLFVNCGLGVVFVLDPATGMVRFGKRYERVGKPDEFRRRSGWTVNRLNFSGWSNDVIVPFGRQMICFSSDRQTIEALDRRTGELIWRTEMSPIGYKVDYLLGVYEDVLYAAGPETIIAYDLNGEGRMIWGAEQLFDDKQSFGRGVLTPKGIYMPVEDSIYHFALSDENGDSQVISRVQVNFGTGAPVGNLYSDGKRFWVHGANRLYALAPKPD